MKLIFNGNILKDDQTFASLGIKEENFVVLVGKKVPIILRNTYSYILDDSTKERKKRTKTTCATTNKYDTKFNTKYNTTIITATRSLFTYESNPATANSTTKSFW
jgi:hypothetical protein